MRDPVDDINFRVDAGPPPKPTNGVTISVGAVLSFIKKLRGVTDGCKNKFARKVRTTDSD